MNVMLLDPQLLTFHSDCSLSAEALAPALHHTQVISGIISNSETHSQDRRVVSAIRLETSLFTQILFQHQRNRV